MPVPAPTQPSLVNPGFETGNLTGWTTEQEGGIGTPSASTARPFAGSYSAYWQGGSGSGHSGGVGCVWFNDAVAVVSRGFNINAQVYISLDDTGSSQNRAEVRLYWYDEDDVELDYAAGTLIRGNSEAYKLSAISGTAPTGTAFARMAVWTTGNTSGGVFFDNATWDYEYNAAATLVLPTEGAVFSETDLIPLSVNITGTTPEPVSVAYKAGAATIASTAVAPFSTNAPPQAAGAYAITAEILFDDDSLIVTTAHNITVSATPPVPITREYKASNSYTFLDALNISGISSAIPAVARVTAVEAVVDYEVQALIRSKDLNVANPETSNPNVAFDITDGGTLQMIMIQPNGDTYNKLGSTYEATIPLDRSDFVIAEEGTSENKKWTVMDSSTASATIGSDESLFGLGPIAATDFADRGFAFRFIPNLLSKPSYADTGDCVFRFKIDKVRIRVYFDAGSVEYYFASPDKTDVIKGRLVSAEVTDGNFETSDASGILQLASDLEVVLGDATAISCDWTIHAAYPPTAANQIGDVMCEGSGVGMSYNGLPTQQQVRDNRSRYVMITANFFGDKDLNSIYGAHGLPRAFAYNGDFFYKIYTQPDAEKDKPRHVAYHHAHLALGFEEGRVDISVAGKPWNFDGVLGATSWAIGDAVVGLLPLSGTILGVFGAKSVWGISGTTSENFATQVISPNIGATEYTICDMGFPVYANAYGVYTLAQVQQYGDYMGQPMSADVSPWLRPRLLRKLTSPAEVVVAWPVRSKNQYRLAFSDGYVMSMTLNGQQVPTFSFQKYFYDTCVPKWVPIAATDVGFSFDGAGGVTMNASTVTGVASSEEVDQSWTITLDTPTRIRLVVQSYNSYPYEEPSTVIFDGVDGQEVTNTTQTENIWTPNPIEPDGEVSSAMYIPVEYSNYPQDSYVIRVEVYQECEPYPNLYSYPSIVPAAVSSQLDESGEERIHIAPYTDEPVPPVLPTNVSWALYMGGGVYDPVTSWPYVAENEYNSYIDAMFDPAPAAGNIRVTGTVTCSEDAFFEAYAEDYFDHPLLAGVPYTFDTTQSFDDYFGMGVYKIGADETFTTTFSEPTVEFL